MEICDGRQPRANFAGAFFRAHRIALWAPENAMFTRLIYLVAYRGGIQTPKLNGGLNEARNDATGNLPMRFPLIWTRAFIPYKTGRLAKYTEN